MPNFYQRSIFIGSLYSYQIATWQHLYFKPGKALIIDSHEWFKNRTATMYHVTRFLYGRNPTPRELRESQVSVVQNAKRLDSATGRHKDISMSEESYMKLTAFYQRHVMTHLHHILNDVRRRGGAVVGFVGKPWIQG